MTDDTATARLDARLDRFESKIDESISGVHQRLDRLADALATIKLLEERVGQNSRSLERAFEKIDTHDKDINQLKHRNAGADKTLAFAERFLWMLATAAVGYYFYAQGGA